MTVPRRARVPAGTARNESGAAAVEFALVSMVLITLLFGMVQYGWYFFSTQSASAAARDTARRLVVGDCTGSGEAESFAQNQSNLSTLALTWGPTSDPDAETFTGMETGDVLQVTVTADANILGFVPMPNGGSISKTLNSRLEDTSASGTC